MRYTWDENKRRLNLEKHGFDFEDAEVVLEADIVSNIDARQFYGEDRWISYGLLSTTVVQVVHTEEEGEVRIISMRKANKREAAAYFQAIAYRLGSDKCDDG